jgi:hypothetical protein
MVSIDICRDQQKSVEIYRILNKAILGSFCLKHVCLQSAYSARTFRVATAYLDRDLDPGAHFCIFVSSRFPSISTDSSDVDTFRTMSVVFYRTLKNQSDFYRFIFCFYFWGCLYSSIYFYRFV